jgi:hypothetical protein
MEVSGQLHAPGSLAQGKSPRYPFDRRLGGLQSRSGHGSGKKIPIPRQKSNTRTPIVHPIIWKLDCFLCYCHLFFAEKLIFFYKILITVLINVIGGKRRSEDYFR